MTENVASVKPTFEATSPVGAGHVGPFSKVISSIAISPVLPKERTPLNLTLIVSFERPARDTLILSQATLDEVCTAPEWLQILFCHPPEGVQTSRERVPMLFPYM